MVNIVQFVAVVKCYLPDLQPLRGSKWKCAERFGQLENIWWAQVPKLKEPSYGRPLLNSITFSQLTFPHPVNLSVKALWI